MSFDPNITQRIVTRARRRIVKDWRSRMRDYSTICLAAGTAAVPVWAGLPADIRAHLPVDYVAWVIGALNAFGLAGKFLIQGPLPEDGNANK